MELTLLLLILSYPIIGIIIFYLFAKWDKTHSRTLNSDISFQESFICHIFLWEIVILVDIYYVLKYNWKN